MTPSRKGSPLEWLRKRCLDNILASPTASEAVKRGIRKTIRNMSALPDRSQVMFFTSALAGGAGRAKDFAALVNKDGHARFEDYYEEFFKAFQHLLRKEN